jgi:hypothetical protein
VWGCYTVLPPAPPMIDPTSPPGAFHLRVTPFGWRLLAAYSAVWLVSFVWMQVLPDGLVPQTLQLDVGPAGYEVATAVPISEALVLHPPGSRFEGVGFRWFQVLTAPFIHPHRMGMEAGHGFSWTGLLLHPAGFNAGGLATLALSILGFGFFAAPVERLLGRKGFLKLWFAAIGGSLLGALLLGPVLRPMTVHFGMGPSVLAVALVACWMTPEAKVRILLFLDVSMKWIGWALIGALAARTLALAAPVGAGLSAGGYEIGGLLGGWAWFRYRDRIDPAGWSRRRRARKLMRVVVDNAVQDVKGADGPIFH